MNSKLLVIDNVSGYDAHCKEVREDVGCAKVLLVSYKTCWCE